jgi:MerR family mercuric resistance operon transcriptional regulator
METNRLVTIGALSERTEVNIETIRYYERIGILPKPPRSAGGHRLYPEEYQRFLVFVRRARELGFSLEDVRALLRLTGDPHMACGKVKGITEKHIADIRRKVNELKRLERVLSAMVTQCRGDDTSDCPILDALAT